MINLSVTGAELWIKDEPTFFGHKSLNVKWIHEYQTPPVDSINNNSYLFFCRKLAVYNMVLFHTSNLLIRLILGTLVSLL